MVRTWTAEEIGVEADRLIRAERYLASALEELEGTAAVDDAACAMLRSLRDHVGEASEHAAESAGDAHAADCEREDSERYGDAMEPIDHMQAEEMRAPVFHPSY